MKQIFSILFLFLPLSIIGQEFSFSMYFEDAVGNKDTVILGCDPVATRGIDPQFGEENILYEPFIKDLDVRIGWLDYYYPTAPDSFLTKKHILPETYFAGQFPSPENIYIYCKHFPLRVGWDPVFNDDWNRYSFVTDWPSHSWFDAVSGGEQGPFFMKDSVSITFDHLNVYASWQDFIPFNGVNLNVLYFSVWRSPSVYSIRKIIPDEMIIYPNPVKSLVHIKTGRGEFEFAQIRDLSGRVLIRSNTLPIQVSTLQEGIYLLEVKMKQSPNGFVQKLSKTN